MQVLAVGTLGRPASAISEALVRTMTAKAIPCGNAGRAFRSRQVEGSGAARTGAMCVNRRRLQRASVDESRGNGIPLTVASRSATRVATSPPSITTPNSRVPLEFPNGSADRKL